MKSLSIGPKSRISQIVGLAVLSIAATFSHSSKTFAQDGIELPGITIFSANRSETELAKEGSSVEIVTKEDLEKSSQTYLVDYLRQVPGVSFSQSGGPGTATNINIRGATSSYVKVLIDGIDVSDPSSPSNTVAFEHLLVSEVSRIEIVKGSQSTLYGSNAVGGLISITTNKPQKRGVTHSAHSEYGSFNSYRGSYSIGYSGDKGNASFTVQGINTDGFSSADENNGNTEDDGYHNVTYSGRGTFHLSDTVSLFFALRAFNAKSEFDDFTFTGPADDPRNNNTDTKQRAGRVGLKFSFFDNKFQNTIAYQGMKNTRETFDSLGETKFVGERDKFEYQGLVNLTKRFSFLFGVDHEENRAEAVSLTGENSLDMTGVYAQGTVEPIDNLTLTLGGRLDDHSEFGSFDTYRATASYQFQKLDLKLRGSVGTGFRAPTISEFFDPNFGNNGTIDGLPPLTPEESFGWDVGADKYFASGRIKVSATYFELDTDQLISFVDSDPREDFFDFRPVNIDGTTERRGVELSAKAVITPRLGVTAAYTYVDTKTENGSRLIRVPKHTFVVGLNAKPTEKLSINTSVKVVNDVVDTDFSQFPSANVSLDNYVLWNAKVSYDLEDGLVAYVRGENLANKEYQTVLDYGTSDIAVYGGLKWHFNKQDEPVGNLKGK